MLITRVFYWVKLNKNTTKVFKKIITTQRFSINCDNGTNKDKFLRNTSNQLTKINDFASQSSVILTKLVEKYN